MLHSHRLSSSFLEPSACLHPGWPTRSRRYAAKFRRTCYIRISDVLRYEQAESLCQKFGLQLAMIDNSPLLERLKQMNMCKRKLIEFEERGIIR